MKENEKIFWKKHDIIYGVKLTYSSFPLGKPTYIDFQKTPIRKEPSKKGQVLFCYVKKVIVYAYTKAGKIR